MTSPRWRMISLVFPCLVACAADALIAQCVPVAQAPKLGPKKESGIVKWRDPFSLEEIRWVEYAVHKSYQRLAYEGCPAPDPYLGATSDFDGVELLTDWCYVKITEPTKEAAKVAARVTSRRPGEVVALTLRDPDRFGPVVLGALRDHLGLGRGREEEWGDIAKAVWDAIKGAAERPPVRFASQETFAPVAPLVVGEGVAGLVAALRATDDTAKREALAVKIIFELAAIDPDGLPLLTELTKFPFIVAKRTIGGAEGTEVAVVIVEAADDPTTADVYYFFLWSDKPALPITVCGVRLVPVFNIEYSDSRKVYRGEFARLHVVQKTVDGSTDWYLDGGIDVREINDITLPEELGAFQAALDAHQLACTEGLAPKVGVTYLGVTLTCP